MSGLFNVKEFIGKKFFKAKTFEHFYNTGIDYFGKEDYDKAIECFKTAISQHDVKSQVYYNLALTYQNKKEYDKAITNYNTFLASSPDDYDGLYNLGLTYYIKENYPKAIENFEKCIEVKQEEDGVKALILAYLSNNDYQKAIDFSDLVLGDFQDGINLYYATARVFETKNTISRDFTYLNRAIEMYLKIAEKDPSNYNAFLSASICHAKKGEWNYSVEYCRKALDLNPESYEANNQMGLVCYCCDDVQHSIEFYEKALKLKPDGDFKIYSNLGYAYEKIGDRRKAIKVFSQLISKFPNCPAKEEIKNHLRILKSL